MRHKTNSPMRRVGYRRFPLPQIENGFINQVIVHGVWKMKAAFIMDMIIWHNQWHLSHRI